jgi:hypothetical protein
MVTSHTVDWSTPCDAMLDNSVAEEVEDELTQTNCSV